MFSYNPVRFLIFMLRLCTIVAEFIKVAGIILVGIFSNNKPSVWFMTLSHVLITILSHWWGPQRYNHISVETGGRKDRNYDWSAFTFWKNWLLLNIRAASGRLTVYLQLYNFEPFKTFVINYLLNTSIIGRKIRNIRPGGPFVVPWEISSYCLFDQALIAWSNSLCTSSNGTIFTRQTSCKG